MPWDAMARAVLEDWSTVLTYLVGHGQSCPTGLVRCPNLSSGLEFLMILISHTHTHTHTHTIRNETSSNNYELSKNLYKYVLRYAFMSKVTVQQIASDLLYYTTLLQLQWV